jgi:hypothetical protein
MEEEKAKARRQRDEVQDLVDRCKAMEKELQELKKRMSEIQRQVESELKRRRSEAPPR